MDIFKRGLPVYHFENRAREDSGITLNDRSFINEWNGYNILLYIIAIPGAQVKRMGTKSDKTCKAAPGPSRRSGLSAK